ncbi:MAG: class II aldolase [Lachnospiraceae bacterium]|nr:class II aldolase [Lachnospiraceae bacterium]
MNIAELIQMSRRYGQNPDYVLVGGGNTSVKDENTLYVKCSGVCLGDMTEQGLVAMDRQKLSALLNKEYPREDQAREAAFLADVMAARAEGDLTKRPSVEALLHNLFPQKYVLHLHPALVNGLTCSTGARDAAAELLGEEALWIPSCRPGYTLGKLCREAMAEQRTRTGREIYTVLLQNHGVFLAGETVEEIDARFAALWERLKKVVRREPDLSCYEAHTSQELSGELAVAADLARETAKWLEVETGQTVNFIDAKEAFHFTKSEATVGPLLRPFTPDHIVYSGAYPLYLKQPRRIREALQVFEEKKGGIPRILLVEGMGAFAMGEGTVACAQAELLFRDAMKVAVYTESFGGPLPMTEDLTAFILHWEAESYRKSR